MTVQFLALRIPNYTSYTSKWTARLTDLIAAPTSLLWLSRSLTLGHNYTVSDQYLGKNHHGIALKIYSGFEK